jgi:hypothetical protein
MLRGNSSVPLTGGKRLTQKSLKEYDDLWGDVIASIDNSDGQIELRYIII